MIIFSLLLLCPLAQETPAANPLPQQDPVGVDRPHHEEGRPRGGFDRARRMWEQMSPEQREQMAERYQHLRQMDPQQIKEMRRRAHALQRERERLAQNITPEERQQLEKMAPHERHRHLNERFREQHERQMAEGHKRMEAHVQQLLEEGWIGPRMVSALRAMPPEESHRLLREIRRIQGGRWRLDGEGMAPRRRSPQGERREGRREGPPEGRREGTPEGRRGGFRPQPSVPPAEREEPTPPPQEPI